MQRFIVLASLVSELVSNENLRKINDNIYLICCSTNVD